MNKDQTTGVVERVLYGAILFVVAKFVKDAEAAAYIAGGGVMLLGSIYALWINRPTALMNSASDQLPKNTVLVVTPTPNASHADKVEAKALADSANEKVIAKAPV